MWLSLKMLRSRILASFGGHRCLPCSLASVRWINETKFFSTWKVYYIVNYRSNNTTAWFITYHSTLAEKLLSYRSVHKLPTQYCIHDIIQLRTIRLIDITQLRTICILVVTLLTLDIVLGSEHLAVILDMQYCSVLVHQGYDTIVLI